MNAQENGRIKYGIAVLIVVALSGWIALFIQTGHIQLGAHPLKIKPIEKVKVFRWNQLTQERGPEVYGPE